VTTIKDRLGYLPKIERTSEIGLPSQKMLYYTIAPQDPYSTPTDQLGHLGHISEKHVLKQHPNYGLEINPSLRNTETPSCCCQDQIRKANVKLYELEQLLSPFADSQYIENMIKSIIKHCNEFGDYDEYVEKCLENHRKWDKSASMTRKY
jgi:hypothetical protein